MILADTGYLVALARPRDALHRGPTRPNDPRDRPAGRQTHYSAQAAALAPLIDWTSQMTGFWQKRFDALEDLLKRMDQ